MPLEDVYPLEELDPPTGHLPEFPEWWKTKEHFDPAVGLSEFVSNLEATVRFYHISLF